MHGLGDLVHQLDPDQPAEQGAVSFVQCRRSGDGCQRFEGGLPQSTGGARAPDIPQQWHDVRPDLLQRPHGPLPDVAVGIAEEPDQFRRVRQRGVGAEAIASINGSSAGCPMRRSTIALSAQSTGESSSHDRARTGPTAGSPTVTSASPADLLFFGSEPANRSISF
jgi:hypothetical protein